jgi:uncharacterized membrane-anchored protein YhcB (DUF1043 family)
MNMIKDRKWKIKFIYIPMSIAIVGIISGVVSALIVGQINKNTLLEIKKDDFQERIQIKRLELIENTVREISKLDLLWSEYERLEKLKASSTDLTLIEKKHLELRNRVDLAFLDFHTTLYMDHIYFGPLTSTVVNNIHDAPGYWNFTNWLNFTPFIKELLSSMELEMNYDGKRIIQNRFLSNDKANKILFEQWEKNKKNNSF